MAVAAAPDPLPGLPEDRESRGARAMWFDGRATLTVASAGTVYSLRRGEAPVSWPTDLQQPRAADGTGGGKGMVVALVGEEGRMARYRGDVWSAELAPLLPGDELIDVTVDGKGRVYAVGRLALYVWDDDDERVRVWPYPDTLGLRPLGGDASPGGMVYLVGDAGRLVRFDGREFERVVVVGAADRHLRAPFVAAWYSPYRSALWVRAGEDGLLSIDPESGVAEPHGIPLFDREAQGRNVDEVFLDGVATLEGDRLVMSAGTAIIAYEQGRFIPVTGLDGPPRGLALVHDEEAAYVATDGGLERFEVAARAAPLDDLEPLDERDRKRLQDDRRRDRWLLTRQRTPGRKIPSIRIAMGPVGHLGDPDDLDGGLGFGLDAGLGAMLGPWADERGATTWFWPEIGYGYASHPRRGRHMATMGLGVGFGNDLIAGFYTPRFVVGSARGDTALGLRHGVGIHGGWGIFGLELQHGMVHVDDRGLEHDLRGLVSLNLAPLIWLAIVAGTY